MTQSITDRLLPQAESLQFTADSRMLEKAAKFTAGRLVETARIVASLVEQVALRVIYTVTLPSKWIAPNFHQAVSQRLDATNLTLTSGFKQFVTLIKKAPPREETTASVQKTIQNALNKHSTALILTAVALGVLGITAYYMSPSLIASSANTHFQGSESGFVPTPNPELGGTCPAFNDTSPFPGHFAPSLSTAQSVASHATTSLPTTDSSPFLAPPAAQQAHAALLSGTPATNATLPMPPRAMFEAATPFTSKDPSLSHVLKPEAPKEVPRTLLGAATPDAETPCAQGGSQGFFKRIAPNEGEEFQSEETPKQMQFLMSPPLQQGVISKLQSLAPGSTFPFKAEDRGIGLTCYGTIKKVSDRFFEIVSDCYKAVTRHSTDFQQVKIKSDESGRSIASIGPLRYQNTNYQACLSDAQQSYLQKCISQGYHQLLCALHFKQAVLPEQALLCIQKVGRVL